LNDQLVWLDSQRGRDSSQPVEREILTFLQKLPISQSDSKTLRRLSLSQAYFAAQLRYSASHTPHELCRVLGRHRQTVGFVEPAKERSYKIVRALRPSHPRSPVRALRFRHEQLTPPGAEGRGKQDFSLAVVACVQEEERGRWVACCVESGYQVVLTSAPTIVEVSHTGMLVADSVILSCPDVRQLREADYYGSILVVGPGGLRSVASEYLRAGASDYLGRPYCSTELQARVGCARTKRDIGATHAVRLRCGPATIDFGSQDAFIGGAPVCLTGAEFKILTLFVGEPDRRFSAQEITRSVLYADARGSSARTHMSHIRKKLGKSAWILQTVERTGYQLHAEARPNKVPD
jgi:DNA-binding response OmpR family regulator